MVNKREKESDRESSDSKKHRKSNSSNSTEIPAKQAKVDVYAVSNFHVQYNLLTSIFKKYPPNK